MYARRVILSIEMLLFGEWWRCVGSWTSDLWSNKRNKWRRKWRCSSEEERTSIASWLKEAPMQPKITRLKLTSKIWDVGHSFNWRVGARPRAPPTGTQSPFHRWSLCEAWGELFSPYLDTTFGRTPRRSYDTREKQAGVLLWRRVWGYGRWCREHVKIYVPVSIECRFYYVALILMKDYFANFSSTDGCNPQSYILIKPKSTT